MLKKASERKEQSSLCILHYGLYCKNSHTVFQAQIKNSLWSELHRRSVATSRYSHLIKPRVGQKVFQRWQNNQNNQKSKNAMNYGSIVIEMQLNLRWCISSCFVSNDMYFWMPDRLSLPVACHVAIFVWEMAKASFHLRKKCIWLFTCDISLWYLFQRRTPGSDSSQEKNHRAIRFSWGLLWQHWI